MRETILKTPASRFLVWCLVTGATLTKTMTLKWDLYISALKACRMLAAVFVAPWTPAEDDRLRHRHHWRWFHPSGRVATRRSLRKRDIAVPGHTFCSYRPTGYSGRLRTSARLASPKTISGCTIALMVSRRLFIADVTGSLPVAEFVGEKMILGPVILRAFRFLHSLC
jgi:hypothetical protein